MEHGINSRALVTAATSISTRTEMISADTNVTTAATNRIEQEVLEIKRKLDIYQMLSGRQKAVIRSVEWCRITTFHPSDV
jgi:hypothetical protein